MASPSLARSPAMHEGFHIRDWKVITMMAMILVMIEMRMMLILIVIIALFFFCERFSSRMTMTMNEVGIKIPFLAFIMAINPMEIR